MSAALMLWISSLVVLWGTLYDRSGGSFAITVAAMGLALAFTAGMPGRLARLAQWLLPTFGLHDMLASGVKGLSGKRDERAMSRLLGAAALVSAAGALASTGGIFLARAWAGAGSDEFMWDTVGWAVVRLVVEWLAMLPMAMGVSLLLLMSAMARTGSVLDGWSSVVREHLVGAACGLGAMGVAWWVGADALVVALVACVAMVVGGAVRLEWPHVTLGGRHGPSVVAAGPSRSSHLAVAGGFAGLAAVFTAQTRIMQDTLAVGFGGQLVWVALSLGVVAVFLARRDSHGRLRGEMQAGGSVLGFPAGLMLQLALGIRCAVGGAEAVACGVLAVAAQVPLAALGAAILSRQRRKLAYAGGRPRQYLASAGAGVAVGMLAYALAGTAGMLGLVGILAGIGCMTIAALRLMPTAGGIGQNLRWAVLCGVLICACGMAPWAALSGLGRVSAGRWLTAWTGTDGVGDTRMSPSAARWRGEGVSAAAREVLAGRPGRWWLVVGGADDSPRPLPATVLPCWAQPDRSVGQLAVPDNERAFAGDFLGDLSRDRRMYIGIYLCPMSACHPAAWRCFNPAVLANCREKLLPGGVLAVRTQVNGDGVGEVLAVAASFKLAVGSGWAVVALGPDGGLDTMLAGPEEALARPDPVNGALVVRLEALFEPGRSVRSIGPRAIWPGAGNGHSAHSLIRRLERVTDR